MSKNNVIKYGEKYQQCNFLLVHQLLYSLNLFGILNIHRFEDFKYDALSSYQV